MDIQPCCRIERWPVDDKEIMIYEDFVRLLGRQKDFDVARQIIAAALNDSRELNSSQLRKDTDQALEISLLTGPKQDISLAECQSQEQADEVAMPPQTTYHEDEKIELPKSKSKWGALRNVLQDGTLIRSNESVLEKWKMVVLEKWDMEKWVRGDGRHSWYMAENETSMIFQHVRTGIIAHFARDSNGWVDVRYRAKNEVECVMCCSKGDSKPSALGPRCETSVRDSKQFREAPRFIKANDFELGAWSAQYCNGRWQICNAHDPAIWIVLGEPGIVYFDGLGQAVHVDRQGLKSLGVEEAHRMFFLLAHPAELRRHHAAEAAGQRP